MSLTRAEIAGWAAKLDNARSDRKGCDPISSTVTLNLDDAYAIQRAGTELRVARGESVVGWKLGYTSLAMRTQMGIEHPNFGPLTDAMLLAHDELVSTSLIQPPMARRPHKLWSDQRFLASRVWSRSQWSSGTTARKPVRRRVQRHQAILRPASSGWLRSWHGKVGTSVPATSSSPVG